MKQSPQPNREKPRYEAYWGVSIFKGRKKIEEKHFKTEKDFALWLLKNTVYEKNYEL